MVEDLEWFVRTRSVALMRYGYVLSGNPHDAADLTQEALARLGETWGRVRDKGDPEGYVRTTMARLHVSWWRRTRRERLAGVLPERAYRDEGISRADDDVGLWQALLALPPRQRVVLVLRYYEQYSDEEIARMLAISRGTVRSQAARGDSAVGPCWRPRARGSDRRAAPHRCRAGFPRPEPHSLTDRTAAWIRGATQRPGSRRFL